MSLRVASVVSLGLFGLLGLGVAACSDGPGGGFDDSQIVFGIQQQAAADGTVSTTADWDLLSLGRTGMRAVARIDASRSCWFEDLGDRVGQPRVEGGLATFRGGALPAGGLSVVANQANTPTIPAPAWSSGATLTFQTNGFAAPSVGPFAIAAPSTELAISAPAPDATLAVTRGADLPVAWDAGDASVADENVLVSFDTDTNTELRCFFDRSAGSGTIPGDFLAALPPAADGGPATGSVVFATHRQLDVWAPGGWTFYIVASNVVRTQAFVTDR